MATNGLSKDFINNILNVYFSSDSKEILQKDIYIGLGLTEKGATVETDDFLEVSGEGYERAKIVFGLANEGAISNISKVVFPKAENDWTFSGDAITMIGIFDTTDKTDTVSNEILKPLVVLPLKKQVTIEKDQTCFFSEEQITIGFGVENDNLVFSDDFYNIILDNSFGTPSTLVKDYGIYLGLGIDFDEESFSFTKEPVEAEFTILENVCSFSTSDSGVIRNMNAISWAKATQDWTDDENKINYLGLYYKKYLPAFEESEYLLIGIIKLSYPETVLKKEYMTLSMNTIEINLLND